MLNIWNQFAYFQVINIINAAQQNSPLTVVEALDRVLEILRQTDLYSPNLNPHQVKEDDQMTTDLVGGLMTMVSQINSIALIFFSVKLFFYNFFSGILFFYNIFFWIFFFYNFFSGFFLKTVNDKCKGLTVLS